MPRISVIVPIYNAINDVKKLLKSLDKNFNFELGEILLINDCSKEETSDYLTKYCNEDVRFKLINNEKNLGFVKTCNRGMRDAQGEILVLLNSDTIIPSNFCEKIIKCFESDTQIGIASPIGSYTAGYYAPLPFGCTLEKMNTKLEQVHKCTYPLIPAAEGFCFCIRRAVIEQQGLLDEIYGKGYHEEVDFAYRAVTNGWKNVLIDNLYVFHKRHASFGKKQRKIQIAKNDAIFNERWLGFREAYIKQNNLQNPIEEIRKELGIKMPDCNYTFAERIFSIKNTKNKKHKIINMFGIKIMLKKRKHKNTTKDYVEYVSFLEKGYQTGFISFKKHNKIDHPKVKPIAFYLPQFHSFKENEEWYGRGFTEWTNVTKSLPMFTGHYQPHLPIDVGFYNLDTTNIMHRQIELAKNYGIYGFSFYYYWFSGRKLMEKPLYNYLNDKSLDFPFCICWACENWSKLWDGGNKELLVESELRENDHEQFWADILPFLKDERYIHINNKPVIIMYRPNKFDTKILQDFIANIRNKAKQEGFEDLYLIWAITNDVTQRYINLNLDWYGFDACLEFPPHGFRSNAQKDKNIPFKKIEGYTNPEMVGNIYDVEKFIMDRKSIAPLYSNVNIYRGIFPMWDNAARKAKTGCLIFDKMTPTLYSKWLKDIIKWTNKNKTETEQFIFINAWNEWAEGAHLEPDSKHGYAYLEKTYEAINEK